MVPDLTGQPIQAVSRNCRSRIGRLRVGIEVGPEDACGRCGQEVLVDNGFRWIAAVIVSQPRGRHLPVGGGEVLGPRRRRVRRPPSRRRTVAARSASARRRGPRPLRTAPAAPPSERSRPHRGSAGVRPAPETMSAAAAQRGRAIGRPLDRVDHRDAARGHARYSSSMSSTRGVKWLMCVLVDPGDVGGHRRHPGQLVVPAAVDRFTRQRERGDRPQDEPLGVLAVRTAVGGDVAAPRR